MVLPICPVCHKQYSNTVKPVVLHPCGHGICESCQQKCEERGLIHCSICRELVTTTVSNYDLRGMCKDEDIPWKQKLTSSMNFLAGEEIELDDSLEVVAPLLELKALNVQSMRKFRSVIAELVQKMEPVDIFDWIHVLQFGNERDLVIMTSKMIDDKIFLESKNALWVLKLVH